MLTVCICKCLIAFTEFLLLRRFGSGEQEIATTRTAFFSRVLLGVL